MASPELEAALAAAQAAAAVIKPFYGTDVAVRTKSDGSPQSEADVRAEEAIRKVLLGRFPAYGFHGEETGSERLDAESVWVVDPIDGTKSFIRESPFFSTQIALLRGGRSVLGVSQAQVYGELAWAEAGQGAWLDGRRIHVSPVDTIERAFVSMGNQARLTQEPLWLRVGKLARDCGRFRGYGDFVHYHLLARGALDVVIESDLSVLDIAAVDVIVREAGGVFTDLEGRPVGLETRSVLAASSPQLHAAVRERLGT